MCLRLLKFNLRVYSFNTYGIKSSSETIQQQLCAQHDLILIQESWLYPDELSYVSNLSGEFSSFSLSSMSIENKLIRGRPHVVLGYEPAGLTVHPPPQNDRGWLIFFAWVSSVTKIFS